MDIDRLTAKDMPRSKEDSRDAVPDGIAAGNLPQELRANYANLKAGSM
jgi:hypothetical protein